MKNLQHMIMMPGPGKFDLDKVRMIRHHSQGLTHPCEMPGLDSNKPPGIIPTTLNPKQAEPRVLAQLLSSLIHLGGTTPTDSRWPCGRVGLACARQAAGMDPSDLALLSRALATESMEETSRSGGRSGMSNLNSEGTGVPWQLTLHEAICK
jgi:hypothetical protein